MARIAPLNIDWKPDRTTGEPVTEQIVGYMCEQVHSGNWPIGSRLPSQRALAEWFGVNRSTVIAAINELSDYGIVEGQHGAGTRIVSNTWSLMLPARPTGPITWILASSKPTTTPSKPSTGTSSRRT